MKTRHCKLTILCLHIMKQNDQCHASKSCEQLIESVGLLQALQAWSAMREFARKTASEMHMSTCKPNMNTCIPEQYFALLTHNVIHIYHFVMLCLNDAPTYSILTCDTHHSTTVVYSYSTYT